VGLVQIQGQKRHAFLKRDPNTLEKLICTCARGVEKVLRIELSKLGATGIERSEGAILCDASPEMIARINVQSRLTHRALLRMAQFTARHENDLMAQLAELPFEEWIAPEQTLSVMAHLREAPWDHSHFAAQRIKDAVVDRIRDSGRARPNVDTERPTLRFVFHWHGHEATLSLDTSGKALHQRGYRQGEGKATLRETLAAAVLSIAHADVRRPFWDPCAGTGTLAIEQAWRSLKRAPGRDRHFAYQRWTFLGSEYEQALEAERTRAKDEELKVLVAPIRLSDHDPRAIADAEVCVARSGMKKHISVQQADAREATWPIEDLVLCTNLPFGDRLGKKQLQLEAFYRSLGENWRGAEGARIIVYSGNIDARRLLDLGPDKRWPLRNGPLAATLYRWDL
jgi:putative N6-adenine-specific DNA methylase